MENKLEELVKYMNSRKYLFTENKSKLLGAFELKNDEEVFFDSTNRRFMRLHLQLQYNEIGVKSLTLFERNDQAWLDVMKDEERELYEFNRQIESRTYSDVLDWMCFGIDSVGKCSNTDGEPINILSFVTILKDGLSAIPE